MLNPESLIHDWNGERPPSPAAVRCPALNDETLRDGLQSPSAIDPGPDLKLRLLHLMAELGIGAVTLGYPAAGPRMLAQTRLLASEIARARLPLAGNCAARTLEADLAPIAAVQAETGVALEAAAFIGTSGVRMAAEGWTLGGMVGALERAVRFAVGQGLAVMFVAEDASRAAPATLRTLGRAAVQCGARRICLADTAGSATPEGVRRLVQFVREEVVAPSPEPVGIDWHGHRDRGLALANCLAAIDAGADRVHATALGTGERAGNAEMELLLANLGLRGCTYGDLTRLPEYCITAARAMGVAIPANHPVVGGDAFRTASGVHAAAVLKALGRGDDALADALYSSLPAREFGLAQRIAISPMSGKSNVRHWLAMHGYDAGDSALIAALLAAAKAADHALADAECEAAVQRVLGARDAAPA
ncbi:MAG TPA: LeuA family protein [Gemmatimonadales bacterium]|nr:LeuA family protein [Gemmatimonadales bacterium]